VPERINSSRESEGGVVVHTATVIETDHPVCSASERPFTNSQHQTWKLAC
jgi:hypothetical protein